MRNSTLTPQLATSSAVAVLLLASSSIAQSPSGEGNSPTQPIRVIETLPASGQGHLEWTYHLSVPPAPVAAGDEAVSEIKQWAKKNNASPEAIKEYEVWAKSRVKAHSAQQNYFSVVKVTFKDGDYLFDTSADKSKPSTDPQPWRFIDYKQGDLMVQLSGTPPESYPLHGSVTRFGATGFDRVASRLYEANLLSGTPAMLPPDAKKVGAKAGTSSFTLPLKTKEFQRADSSPYNLTLELFDATRRIKSLQVQRKDAQKPAMTIVGSDFTSDEVAQKIVVQLGANGAREEYNIQSVNFGPSADLSALNNPVPPKTKLEDYRWAPRPGVQYQVRQKLPPDPTILKLVEQRERNDAAAEQQAKLTTTRNIALPLGALLLVGGIIWWRRSRQTSA